MRTEFSKLGYFLNYRALKAEDYGVPQLRRRVFIIGNRSDIKPFEFPDVSISQPFTVRDAISNLPRIGVNDGVDELVITNYQTQSKYQEWLIGECNVESLLSSKPRQPLPKKQLELFGNC